MARLKVTVLGEHPNDYISGKGVQVKERLLDVYDAEPCNGATVAGSMLYVLTDEEKSLHPKGSLTGKVVDIGVSRFDAHNGKIKLRGALPPPEALKGK